MYSGVIINWQNYEEMYAYCYTVLWFLILIYEADMRNIQT